LPGKGKLDCANYIRVGSTGPIMIRGLELRDGIMEGPRKTPGWFTIFRKLLLLPSMSDHGGVSESEDSSLKGRNRE
jgi:hypothetical protein